MSAGEYLAGAGYLLLVVGGSLAVAVAIAARRQVEAGLPRWLAVGLLACLFVFVAHLVPGIVGELSRESVAATAIVLFGLAFLVPPRTEPASGPELPWSPASTRLSSILGYGALALVAVYALALVLERADEALLQVDVVSFHLPNVARWIQTGSMWQVDDFIPHRAPGNYPQTGDVFMLAAVLPWENDFLARFVPLPFLGLTALGIIGTGRELGVRASTAALTAAAFIAMPAVVYIAANGLADPEMLGTFSAGGYFLVRHWRTGDRTDLILAGIGLGLAFGTRWYAVPAVGAAVAVWLLASWLAGREWRQTVRDGATVLALVAMCGGFWLLRNLVESGNPVFPVEVAPLGITLFDAPPDLFRELQGFSLSDYLTEPDVWANYLWEPFLDFMSWTALAFWGSLALGTLLAVARLRADVEPRGARLALALAGFAGLVGLAYLITPYSASGLEGAPGEAWVNARYVVPALLAGAVVAGWTLMRLGRVRQALEVLLAIAVLDALRRGLDFPGGDLSLWAVVGAAGVVAVAAWVLAGGRPEKWAVRPRPATAAAASAVVVAMVVLGGLLQDRYDERRYTGITAPFDFIDANARSGTTVGIVGDGFGNYPLFGPELDNEVSYIGPRVDEMLRSYTDRDDFLRAVSDHDYDLVLVEELATVDVGLPERQERWLTSLGYQEVAAGGHPTLGKDVELRLYSRS